MTDQAILVTGAAGFIGFHVARQLLAEGRPVIGLDNLNSYYDPALKRARLDVLRKERGFAVSDRISVVFYADGELAQAIDEHKDYIMGETLSLQLEPAVDAQAVVSEVDGRAFSFQIEQAGSF